MEYVWILAALCTGFVAVNMPLLNRKAAIRSSIGAFDHVAVRAADGDKVGG
jgi:hypothetical protein